MSAERAPGATSPGAAMSSWLVTRRNADACAALACTRILIDDPIPSPLALLPLGDDHAAPPPCPAHHRPGRDSSLRRPARWRQGSGLQHRGVARGQGVQVLAGRCPEEGAGGAVFLSG